MAERSEAENAGRGVIFIAAAKIYFMVAGFAIDVALPALMGRFAYGAYGVVNSWVSNFNNVVVQGTIQAVSRQTTADPAHADEVKAAGVRMHLYIGLPLAVGLAVCAPLAARFFFYDPGKAGLLALAAAIVALYSFYTVFVGSANGLRRFDRQAKLDVTFATLRAGIMIAATAIGFGVWGAIGGWVAAAATVLVIAVLFIGPPRGDGRALVAPMRRFLLGVAAYLVIMNLIMAVDLLLLKRLAAEWFHAHPETLAGEQLPILEAAAKHADGQVGYYRAVQTLARLPYQLMIAVTFVIFPLVSRATFENDHAKTRGYIRATMRYSLIIAGLMGAVLASNPTAILDIPFAPDFATTGGAALLVLALGNVAFVLFSIAGTILNGAGRTREAILVAGVTLALLVVGLWIGIPRATPGRGMLLVCAAATTGAMVLGAAISGLALAREFGAFLPVASFVRVLAATAAALAVGRLVGPRGMLITIAGAIAAAIAYLAVLVVTRELGKADLAALGRIVRRKP